MTCIVGIARDGRTWIGGDSCVVDAEKGMRETSLTPKVWRSGGYVIGAAGNSAWYAILRRVSWPREVSSGYPLTQLMTDLVRSADTLGIKLPCPEEDDAQDGSALIGGAGFLWYVDSDLSVDAYSEMSCGSGAPCARSVLSDSPRGKPRTRILRALKATAAVKFDVGPPFTVESA